MREHGSAIGVWTAAVWLGLAGGSAQASLHTPDTLTARSEQAATEPARQQAARPARITVRVPHDDTVLALDDRVIVGTGATREVQTVPLGPRERGTFTLTASWNPNAYTTMTRTTRVSAGAGEQVTVDLTRERPDGRVRVVYVPTPDDVAAEMVALAGVRPGDVVFEPGCGDARITIAAVRAGASRAICVDLDAERARESRANVERAGLADRIDVRQGDALDVKDLAEVTVVFLYMGDHFNLLIRPVLWRMLPPGARVVSHRFTMGDWAPDRSVAILSYQGGGTYDLHLWTITDAVKRKAP